MDPDEQIEIELADLAEHLRTRRAAILAAWARVARNDPNLTTPATLSRTQFYDHIPAMLDALERKLRATYIRESLEAQQEETENAEGHGLQRWQQGYNEQEVMREWISLNACLADELTAYVTARPGLDPAASSAAWRLFSEFSVAGMSESMAQYVRLQRAQAAGRVRSLENALAQLAELEQQRAEAWREATHDLRGNLGVVRNVTSALQMTASSEPALEKWLRMLESGVASLHALLNDLTMQARLDAGHETREVRPFDAGKLLTDLCANAELAAAGRQLFLETEGPKSLVVEGDEVKVRRIAQNLLLNALRYTERGGVRVMWQEATEAPKRWVMCVQDTGPGLGTQVTAPLSAALEAATRDAQAIETDARRAGESSANAVAAPTLASRSVNAREPAGEGIGLSIVKRLCELLDASLELQTEAGKGTTFRVTFPSTYTRA
ncbi:MAG: sensor histidine kinase [Burkholderiaceae bacterium]|nr:sensor histidine kinase [Burkholderiaceae bacterium]